MNEIEFARLVDRLADEDDPTYIGFVQGLSETEQAVANAELERRGSTSRLYSFTDLRFNVSRPPIPRDDGDA